MLVSCTTTFTSHTTAMATGSAMMHKMQPSAGERRAVCSVEQHGSIRSSQVLLRNICCIPEPAELR